MIIFKKPINGIHVKVNGEVKEITKVYKGSRLIWEAVKYALKLEEYTVETNPDNIVLKTITGDSLDIPTEIFAKDMQVYESMARLGAMYGDYFELTQLLENDGDLSIETLDNLDKLINT